MNSLWWLRQPATACRWYLAFPASLCSSNWEFRKSHFKAVVLPFCNDSLQALELMWTWFWYLFEFFVCHSRDYGSDLVCKVRAWFLWVFISSENQVHLVWAGGSFYLSQNYKEILMENKFYIISFIQTTCRTALGALNIFTSFHN